MQGKRVLDVGCNTGVLTVMLAKQYHPQLMFGIDIDNTLVSRCISTLRSEQQSAEMQAAASLSVEAVESHDVTDPITLDLATRHPELTRPHNYFPIQLCMAYGPLPFDQCMCI